MFQILETHEAANSTEGKSLRSDLRAAANKHNTDARRNAQTASEPVYMRHVVATDKNLQRLVVGSFNCPTDYQRTGDVPYSFLVHGATIKAQDVLRGLGGIKKQSDVSKAKTGYALLRAKAEAKGAIFTDDMSVEEIAETITAALIQ